MSSQLLLNLLLIAKLLPDLDFTNEAVMKMAHQIKSCYITFKCQQVYDPDVFTGALLITLCLSKLGVCVCVWK